MLEQPHLDFAHEPPQARRAGTAWQMVRNVSIKYMLRISRQRLKRALDEAKQNGAAAGVQAYSGAAPHVIEILGERSALLLPQGEDTLGGQPHIAHLGDIM